MNQPLVDALFQLIQTLSPQEQAALAQKLEATVPQSTSQELAQWVQAGGSFEFLQDEPALYTLEDGESLSFHA
jgi:hypothetical protein